MHFCTYILPTFFVIVIFFQILPPKELTSLENFDMPYRNSTQSRFNSNCTLVLMGEKILIGSSFRIFLAVIEIIQKQNGSYDV